MIRSQQASRARPKRSARGTPRPVQTAVAPSPSAPPLPFTYMGKLMSEGELAVFLVQGERNLIVHEGDTIDSLYRVERIAEGDITLLFLPLNERQTTPHRRAAVSRVVAVFLLILAAGCAAHTATVEGRRLVEQGRTEEGIRRLEQGVKANPNDTELRNYYVRTRDLYVQPAAL